MGFLGSPWFLGILSLVLVIVTQLFLVVSKLKPIFTELKPPDTEEVVLRKSGFFSFRSQEIETLVANLTEEKIKYSKSKSELKELEVQLNAEKKELQEMQKNIEKMMANISSRILLITKSEKKNLGELATTYSNLTPESAVEVFKEMDDMLIVKILASMEPAAVAPVFQAMIKSSNSSEYATKRVARLSELLRMRVQE